MRKWTVALLIAAASFIASPALAVHTLNATWVITYYLDPAGSSGGTQCLIFGGNHIENGVITGTWSSPTFPGWKGQWVERGQHYAWHGFYVKNGAKIATYDVGDFVTANITAETSIGKLQYGGNGPFTLATGTATMTQVPSCSAMPIRAGTDPF